MAYRRNLRDYKRSSQPAFDASRKVWIEEELKKLEVTLQSIIETYNPSYIGGFQSNVTQSAAVINTPYAIYYDTTDYSYGVSVKGSPLTKITVDNPGTYNLEFSAQLAKSSANIGYVHLWFRKNGVDVVDSATKLAIQGSSAETVASWNFVFPNLIADDYIEIMWSVTDTNIHLLHDTATATYPAIPSVITTMTQVAIAK